MQQLEEKHVDENNSGSDGEPRVAKLQDNIQKLSMPQMQMSIFDTHSETFEEIRKRLDNIDINRLTPVEALMKLNEIKGLLK
jgi:DNA mismatch repair protein MutS